MTGYAEAAHSLGGQAAEADEPPTIITHFSQVINHFITTFIITSESGCFNGNSKTKNRPERVKPNQSF